jgi:hypothetical protein
MVSVKSRVVNGFRMWLGVTGGYEYSVNFSARNSMGSEQFFVSSGHD